MNAILEVVRQYRREFTGLANLAAASQGVFFDLTVGEIVHYLRTESPLTPEAVAAYPRRLEVTRTNPYLKPGAFLDVGSGGLESFETRQCTSGVSATINPADAADAAFQERVDGDAAEATQFFERIQLFAFNDELDTNAITPMGCTQQSPFDSVGSPDEQSQYLHVRDLPNP